jgi:hypothetical protein
LESAVTNENYTREEIKSRLTLGNWIPPFSSESFVFLSPIQKCEGHSLTAVILLFVLCGCVTWSLTVREAHLAWTVDVREQGAERDIWNYEELTGGWRKLYSSANVITVI